MTAIPQIGVTSPSNATQLAPTSGQSLTANDFINFLVTELQNQNPLQPTDSNQMLTQLSEIGQLESASNLQTSLTGLVTQNQISAASAMIGKQVVGTDQNQLPASGLINAVSVNANGVNLQLDNGQTMPLANVTNITDASSSSSSTSGTSN